MSTLTTARTALKNAIARGDGLECLELKVFGDQDDFPVGDKLEPAVGDLPALFVQPGSVSFQEYRNTGQLWSYQLPLELWTDGWLLADSETLTEAIIAALFRQGESPTSPPFIKAALGRHPEILGVNQQATNLDNPNGPPVVLTTITVRLLLLRNPYPVG